MYILGANVCVPLRYQYMHPLGTKMYIWKGTTPVTAFVPFFLRVLDPTFIHPPCHRVDHVSAQRNALNPMKAHQFSCSLPEDSYSKASVNNLSISFI